MTIWSGRITDSGYNATETLNVHPVYSNTILYWGRDADQLYTGFIWDGVNIPSGATINTAYMRVTDVINGGGAASMVIYGEETATATAFSDGANSPINRTSLTTASVTWTETFGSGAESTNDDEIKTVIQEIVDTVGAVTDVTLILDDVSGSPPDRREDIESYGTTSTEAAYLYIDYTASGGSPAPIKRSFMSMGMGR